MRKLRSVGRLFCMESSSAKKLESMTLFTDLYKSPMKEAKLNNEKIESDIYSTPVEVRKNLENLLRRDLGLQVPKDESKQPQIFMQYKRTFTEDYEPHQINYSGDGYFIFANVVFWFLLFMYLRNAKQYRGKERNPQAGTFI